MIDMLVGDVRACLAELESASVHCVVTSPPYWGLRDYGLEPVEWADGWVGCLGLEPTPEQYVEHLLEVLDLGLRRVLRSDGVLWLNLGDCYAGGKIGRDDNTGADLARRAAAYGTGTGAGRGPLSGRSRPTPDGLKPKDLIGIPWRVADAMQARGWYLRAEIPWVKRNVLPSSVRDRPTTAHETVFLFAHPDSGGRYFYDVEAVKVASGKRGAAGSRFDKGKTGAVARRVGKGDRPASDAAPARQLRDSDFFFDSLRRLRDDLTTILNGGEGLLHDENGDPSALVVNLRPFKEAHFAVFPPQLVEPMIKAGTSEHGACGSCGAPWVRKTGRECPDCGVLVKTQAKKCKCGRVNDWKAGRFAPDTAEGRAHGATDYSTPGRGTPRKTGSMGDSKTIAAGWAPSCSCADNAPAPATVLDPFSGAGTTSMVAEALGRDSIYIDQSDEFADIAERRWNAAAKKG